MRRIYLLCSGIGMAAALSGARPLSAQEAPAPAVDPAGVEVPDLSFPASAASNSNFGKYVYFHRADTDFATAYADIRECDAYARGVGFYVEGGPATGAVTGIAVDAIFGSAERRRIRRVNMRVCMRFKDYRIFGLPEQIWERFNFEEGNTAIADGERERMLRIQARVASGPRPTIGEVPR